MSRRQEVALFNGTHAVRESSARSSPAHAGISDGTDCWTNAVLFEHALQRRDRRLQHDPLFHDHERKALAPVVHLDDELPDVTVPIDIEVLVLHSRPRQIHTEPSPAVVHAEADTCMCMSMETEVRPGVLGLRLVKLTVNFDDPETHHFYFGNEDGAPSPAAVTNARL